MQYSTSEFPITLGRDCSGIVVEIGPSVSKLEIGDEVWLVSPFWNTGTIAEYVLTTEDMVAKKPKGMGFEAASSIPYAGCLAYNACLKAGIIGNGHNRKRCDFSKLKKKTSFFFQNFFFLFIFAEF